MNCNFFFYPLRLTFIELLRRERLQVFPNAMLCSRVNQRRLAGKRDSRRYSTTSFSENVVVAETSYQMYEV